MSSQKIIDAWLQHPTKRMIENPIFDSLKRWTKASNTIKEIPIEFTVGALEMANIEKGLICSWTSPHGSLISNEEVAGWVKQYPDKFIGIGSVPLNRPMKAVEELKKCINEYGFKGIRVLQWLWNLPATHAYYYPLYVECINLNIPICFQVGHTGPLMPSEVGRPIPYIDQVAIDFPELKIVCGHVGYPWTTEMIAVATKHQNVYIDTSAYTAKRYPKELVQYIKTHGNKKVLFGSNYPMILPKKCLQDLDLLELDKNTKDQFLYQNTVNVFNL